MPTTFSLTLEQYEALVEFARRGAANNDQSRSLAAFLESIDKSNGITRSRLWVQWQEADSSLPPTTRFPDKWPPELRHYIEFLSRPVSKADVEAVLRAKARHPVSVLVTPDPGATVGWTELGAYFDR